VSALTKHDPYHAFRFSNFRLLFASSTLNVFGFFLESTALGWELYERTHDPLVLGNVGLVEFLPVLLFALPAGHIADRFDRKRVAIVSRLFESVGALGLAYLSFTQGSIALIYAFILLTSIARTFSSPAYNSLVPHSVPNNVFENAVTWQMNSFQIAGVTAPALAGGLIALTKVASWNYLLSAGLSIVIAVLLWRVTIKTTTQTHEAATLKDIFAGARFIFKDRLILSAITLDLFAVLFGGALALLPIFAKDVLYVGAERFGILRAAPAFGAVLMGFALTRMPAIKHSGKVLLVAVTGFGLATILFGVSKDFWLSCFALALTGATDNVSMVVRGALVPLRTPDEMRGRVGAVERVFISSSNELGAWESGVAAWLFGPILAVIGGGVGTLIVVSLIALFFPQLRKLGELTEASIKQH
jgi:MFS family permease